MTAAYCGGTTIGGEVPLLSNTYTSILQAVTEAVVICTSLSSDLLAALQAIRAVTTVPLEVQLQANLDIQVNLNTSLEDPAAYFADLYQSLLALQAQIASIPPVEFSPDLEFQIAAAVDIAAQLQAQIALIEEALALLNAIVERLNALTAFLNQYIVTNLISYLTTTGVHSFIFQGNLNTFGGEANAVTPLSGFPGTAPVRMVFFFVSANDVAAVNAMNALFKVTP